ncbi:hypothetical protein BaRGS_00001184 [Batillaria attramentaria]|uniref:G-protein coupled receptors family 1 profile domain-containing protein n=1 Tax=Batillaria attramentaria TaxID=370345 RepID=A0ABD0M790_9CAEN
MVCSHASDFLLKQVNTRKRRQRGKPRVATMASNGNVTMAAMSDGHNWTTDSFSNTTLALTTQSATANRMALYRLFLKEPLILTAIQIQSIVPWFNLAVGLPGSLLSFFVLIRMRPFTSSLLYLCALAVSDAAFVVVALFYYYGYKFGTSSRAWACQYAFWLSTAFTTFPNFVTAVLGIERCIAIWLPLKVGLISTKKKASIVVLVIAIVSIGTAMPACFGWYFNWDLNSCQLKPEMSSFILDVWYKFLTATVVAPTLIILIVNILIVTLMLLAVFIVFVVTSGPWAFMYAVRDYWDFGDLYSAKHVYMTFSLTTLNHLKDINHSTNFVCYILTARRFRAALLDLLCCGRRKAGAGKTQFTATSDISTRPASSISGQLS